MVVCLNDLFASFYLFCLFIHLFICIFAAGIKSLGYDNITVKCGIIP